MTNIIKPSQALMKFLFTGKVPAFLYLFSSIALFKIKVLIDM